MKAILVISHGSHSLKLIPELEDLVAKIKKTTQLPLVSYAFLEIAQPDIPTGIDQCIKKGATEVVVLLNFLNSGRHVDVDIQNIILDAKKKHPNISIRITKPVGQHPRIAELFIDLI